LTNCENKVGEFKKIGDAKIGAVHSFVPKIKQCYQSTERVMVICIASL